MREVLATCLSQPLVDTEEFQKAAKLLKLMSREEMLPILRNALEVLQGGLLKISFEKIILDFVYTSLLLAV